MSSRCRKFCGWKQRICGWDFVFFFERMFFRMYLFDMRVLLPCKYYLIHLMKQRYIPNLLTAPSFMHLIWLILPTAQASCPEYKWQKPRTIFSLYKFPADVSRRRMVWSCLYSLMASSFPMVAVVAGPLSSRCNLYGWIIDGRHKPNEKMK